MLCCTRGLFGSRVPRADAEGEFNWIVDLIREYLGWLAPECGTWNGRLPQVIRAAVDRTQRAEQAVENEGARLENAARQRNRGME